MDERHQRVVELIKAVGEDNKKLMKRIAELEKLIVDSFETEEGEYHLSREWLKLTESKQKLKWEDL